MLMRASFAIRMDVELLGPAALLDEQAGQANAKYQCASPSTSVSCKVSQDAGIAGDSAQAGSWTGLPNSCLRCADNTRQGERGHRFLCRQSCCRDEGKRRIVESTPTRTGILAYCSREESLRPEPMIRFRASDRCASVMRCALLRRGTARASPVRAEEPPVLHALLVVTFRVYIGY